MKVMIVVRGHASCGKSSSIKQAYKKLCDPAKDTDEGDVCEHIDTPWGLIGFTSFGDYGNEIYEGNLKRLINSGCKIIVTACRTRGGTVEKVLEIAGENGYQIVWFSPCFCETGNHAVLNEVNAAAIVQLIERFALL
ncbi:MAG: hypothetical protein J5871_03825 [Bacteroidales bacterium]|nr:hypothetical protein [Bacteroidales bacterium]